MLEVNHTSLDYFGIDISSRIETSQHVAVSDITDRVTVAKCEMGKLLCELYGSFRF
jgi:hypothetical protein